MEKLWADASPTVPGLMQEMALFFNLFVQTADGTLYGRLAAEVQDAGLLSATLFSSLNYENLFEFDIWQTRRMAISPWLFPPPEGEAAIFKLHGSCNYVTDSVFADRAGVTFTRGVSFNGPLNVLASQLEVRSWMTGANAVPPAMCLYMHGKPVQTGAPMISAIQQRWREVVSTASTVVIIGVRPNPHDAHLWDAIAGTDATVCFVGDGPSISPWVRKHRGKRSTVMLGSRFKAAFPDVVKALTIRQGE
jgi:hypothetical protein